jgi:hypothetical protein
MKSFSKKILFIFIGIIVLVVAGYFVWQKYKYKIVRNSMEIVFAKQTDSLYTVKYDSLSFDAVTGNASLKNIRIIPDTARAKALPGEKMPDMMMDVTIQSLILTGVKTAKALTGSNIEGDSVIINKPVITLYSMRPLQKGTKIESEASSFYKEILGKLNHIKVGFVFINNVDVKGINFITKEKNFDFINGKFLLEDVLIDSSHNFDTSRVLFCKQAAFTVDSFFSYDHNRKEISVKDVNFLGKQKQLLFDEIAIDRFHDDTSKGIRLLDAKTLKLSGVNSNQIVKNKNLFVDTILCKEINLYELPAENLKTTGGNKSRMTDSTGFANVYGVYMQHLNFPNVAFIPFAKSKYSMGNIAVKINDVKADQIVKLETHPMDYTKEAEVAISSFSIKSKDDAYNFDFKNIVLNSMERELRISSFDVIPHAGEKQFANNYKYQNDRYDVGMKEISLKNIDMNSLIDKRLEASELIIDNISAKISRDKHKPLKKESKVGKYLSQLLTKLDEPINISKATINNAFIQYRENEPKSDSVGEITFQRTNLSISNITNIPGAIKNNNQMIISFDTKILGQIPLKGNFKFRLDSDNGNFTTSGHAGAFDALILNKVSIPMALIKINSGKINSLDFDFTGNNTHAKGNFLMKYDDLKLDVLKIDKNTKKIKKRGLLSMAANLVVKNSNPLSGDLRKETPEYVRDIYKSFFNLVWKTVFTGMKQTVGIP